MGRTKSTKKKQSNNQLRSGRAESPKLPFIEHVYELRKRLFYVAVSVALFSGLAYGVEHPIVSALLKPAHGQKFIYTSPGGGIDFLFRVCLYVGIATSIPVIVYQLLRYIEPLIKKGSMRFIAWGSIVSGVLAVAGMLFGYFIGLPAALHFLLHQFTTTQIQALLTIQAYMSFVTMYMLGSAMLFQFPLILLFINRVKPLKPSQLFGFERWVILIAFVLGGIMNPSPSIIDQLLLAGPMILMYQVGIVIIWAVNRRHAKPRRVQTLIQKDAEVRTVRQQQFQAAKAQWREPAGMLATTPVTATTTTGIVAVPRSSQPVATKPLAKQPQAPASIIKSQPAVPVTSAQPQIPHIPTARPDRPRPYLNDFTRRTYRPTLRSTPTIENA